MLSEQKVIEIINHTLGLSLHPDTTNVDATLKSLGIDSLDLFNIIAEIEILTGKSMLDEDIQKIISIKSLALYFS